MTSLAGRHVLLIIGGGVAAYKSLLLIRLLRQQGAAVDCVLTDAGARFVTPLSVQALSGRPVMQDLWAPTAPDAMDHIRLPRPADIVVVAPATADLLARMRAGLADDLATTLLLANDRPVLVAPAMNPVMWEHPATQDNMAALLGRGVVCVGPDSGEMACGDNGAGRLAEPEAIFAAIADHLAPVGQALRGKRVLVTSGPTREKIDPVRYLSNHSSGLQGHAIAQALAHLGADVVLVSGPVAIPAPQGMEVVRVETALEMQEACQAALPADAAICVAAVADWRVAEPAAQKLKKSDAAQPPSLHLVANPDILAGLAAFGPGRPKLVVGFAAETEHVVAHAQAKRLRKGCDWLIANLVGEGSDAMGGLLNEVYVLTEQGIDHWPQMPKTQIARQLAARVAVALQ